MVNRMPTVKKKYLTDEAGKRVGVIVDLKTFERIEDELDELACIRAYDKAKPEAGAAVQRGDYVTLEEYLAKRKSKKRVRRSSGNR